MNLLPPFSIRLSRREVLKHFAAGSLGAASLPNFASNEKLAAVSGITIRDDLGEHVFQTIPQRPAVLQWDLLENLVGLGVKPAGACDISSWDTWVREPALPAGIEDLGTRAEPNLERIAKLKPDVILIGPTQLDLMPVLATIAPVLLFSNYRADAPENEAETALKQFRELAKLFQREAAAEAEIARWFAQIDAYGDAIRKAFDFAPQIQVIRFSSLTTLFVYTPNSIADWVVRRMGMAQPLTRPASAYGLTQVRIRDLKNLTDAYVIYIRPFAQEAKVMNSILWCATPFARKHHVAPAEPYWSHGGAPSILTTAKRITEALLTLAPSYAGRTEQEGTSK